MSDMAGLRGQIMSNILLAIGTNSKFSMYPTSAVDIIILSTVPPVEPHYGKVYFACIILRTGTEVKTLVQSTSACFAEEALRELLLATTELVETVRKRGAFKLLEEPETATLVGLSGHRRGGHVVAELFDAE